MSDSDTDLLPNDVLTFQSLGATISARGPNINNTNISSLSFRNNVMTSTMNMPWNMDRPRYAESVCDQRSMYYRRERETSPMSFHSASGMPPQNLQRSYYPGAMSSHRSMYNGRSGSPMSVRTIDSNTSISAKDIALAFQNGTFNKFDFKMIKDAYNRFIKHRTRRRIEKRRNVRMFLKGFRRKSGDDSGDQASNSSISSDDCASIRTSRSTIYKANMSSCRSTKTDISDFRRTMRESNIIRDCTENMRQNSFKTILSQGRSRGKESWQNLHEKWQKESMDIRGVKGVNTQKDRFKSSMLLPSQRFNHSISSITVAEKPNRLQRINEGNTLNTQNCVPNQNQKPDRQSQDTESEQEEIFANVTVMERNCSNSGKRIHEEDVFLEQEKKRTKISPIKNKPNTPKQNKQTTKKQKSNDFVFAKPQLPVKKQTISKQPKLISSHKPNEIPHHEYKQSTKENMTSQSILQPIEKVISGSQSVIEELISKSTRPSEPSTENISLQIHQEKEIPLSRDTTQHSATDMSMRPSFIKRKLFTQKVDVAEKNSSSDSLQADSPQTNIYSKIQKERNKARKLVTSQSCLNRDVQDDSNLLDLIHKIVPADRMNVTTATNRTEIQNNKSKPEKWDVTSLITTCDNIDDISDTFTDEDVIFAEDSEKRQKKQSKTLKYDEKQQDAEVIKNIPIETKKKTIHDQKKKPIHKAKENYADKSIEASSRTINEQKKNLINEATKLKPANGKTNLNNEKQKVIYSKAEQQNPTGCKVIVQKLQSTSPSEKNDLVKANIYKGVKSFWDTDAESDLDATPLKGKDPKNKVTPNPEIVEKDFPLKNDVQLNKVGKESNVSDLSRNKLNEALKIKITANQTMNLSLKNKPKESKTINQSKKPTTNNQIVAENKKAESEVKSNKKTLPASLKENKPPHTECNKNASNNGVLSKMKPNENGKGSIEKKEETKKRVGRLQKYEEDEDMKLDKIKSQTNNNNLILNNKESRHTKVHNNTLRIRAQRKPKELKCCGEPDTSDFSESNNNSTLCRSLRSRLVDLSASLKSDDSVKKTCKKPAPKPKKSKVKTDDACKAGGEIASDVSFTLTTEVLPAVNRTLRNRKTSDTSKERKPRQSDVSFTLSENKLFNTSISTRSKRNREIESLQNNSAFLFGKRSAINRTIALKSRSINRSNNTRLNKSRQLL